MNYYELYEMVKKKTNLNTLGAKPILVAKDRIIVDELSLLKLQAIMWYCCTNIPKFPWMPNMDNTYLTHLPLEKKCSQGSNWS